MPLAKGMTAYLCGKAGSIIGDLPPYEAFPIGGTESVRGYSEGGVGTGRSYAAGTAELHFPLLKQLPFEVGLLAIGQPEQGLHQPALLCIGPDHLVHRAINDLVAARGPTALLLPLCEPAPLARCFAVKGLHTKRASYCCRARCSWTMELTWAAVPVSRETQQGFAASQARALVMERAYGWPHLLAHLDLSVRGTRTELGAFILV